MTVYQWDCNFYTDKTCIVQLEVYKARIIKLDNGNGHRNVNSNRNYCYKYLNESRRMVYSDTDGELLAEHNIVKANPEDDVFQNMATQGLIWGRDWRSQRY